MNVPIVLTTLNARFIHASLGLRYLRANLGDLRQDSEILEFTIDRAPLDIVGEVLQRDPKIVGLGVYIWNVSETREVVRLLKILRPGLTIVLGGPEVSHDTSECGLAQDADYVVRNEGDLVFPDLCRRILAGANPSEKWIDGGAPDLLHVRMPYEEYTSADVQHRIIYVEASRGCPFECEFCLSALEVPVRLFPKEEFINALRQLFERGVRHFKFVDRTFNLNLPVAIGILEFFLSLDASDLFLHFEMIPDRFPGPLRDLVRRFKEGQVQFEVGIQTFDESVGRNISRRQDLKKLEDNLTFLRQETGVHVHADLIVGLPGESKSMFAAGFDRLVALGPDEIQVGILKRLSGTPIIRHDQAFQMTYSPFPPYEILSTVDLPFFVMQDMKCFAKVWDLLANSGNFKQTTPLLWLPADSPFEAVFEFARVVRARFGQTHAIALARLAECLFNYLRDVRGMTAQDLAPLFWNDWRRGGRFDRPPFLKDLVEPVSRATGLMSSGADRRQRRHKGDA